jgi:hypothetical protein
VRPQANTEALVRAHRRARQCCDAALRAGDADDVRRSLSMAEVYLAEARWAAEQLPEAVRTRLWVLTSVSAGR